MLVHKTIANYSSIMFYMIIESNSQKTFFSFVLCTNMAAMTSGENHLYAGDTLFLMNDLPRMYKKRSEVRFPIMYKFGIKLPLSGLFQ